MSSRTRPPASSRFELRRYAEEPAPPDLVASVEDALRHGHTIEFQICRDAETPLFSIAPFRGAVHVLGCDGGHLATCASVETALNRGWEHADPVRPARSSSGRRRSRR